MWDLYIITITLHFIFDWILQPRYIAKSKKESMWSLTTHMLLNILPFTFLLAVVLVVYDYNHYTIIGICILNFVSHFAIDAVLPSGNNERQMINWTAVDQILHMNILIVLLQL